MNRKWDIQRVKELFSENGCCLISKEYMNTVEKLKYIATCGHENEISIDNFKAGKGRLCKRCRYKKIGEKRTLQFDVVKKVFEQNNCMLISTEYVNNTQKLDYIASCGHTNKITYEKFKSGVGRVCNKCSKSIRYEYDFVAEQFENEDCILLDKEYINCKTPMKYIAQCGHETVITFDVFLNSKAPKRCRNCQKTMHYTIETVNQIFSSDKCKVLSDTYQSNQKIKYIAQCGHEHEIELSHYLEGQGRQCKKCSKLRGPEHYNFNPELTDAERIQKRDLYENILWRNKVYERDGFRCQKCGYDKGGILVAHHLNGYSNYKDERFDIENGITLCKYCHNIFHMKYGYGNNSKAQFLEFIQHK